MLFDTILICLLLPRLFSSHFDLSSGCSISLSVSMSVFCKKINNKIYMYLCSIMFGKCLKSVRYNTNLGSLTPFLYLLITVGITHNYIIYRLHLFLLHIFIILLQILPSYITLVLKFDLLLN